LGGSSDTPRPPLTYYADTRLGEIAGVLVTAVRGTYRPGCEPALVAEVAARYTAAIAADPATALALAGPRFAAYSLSERATDLSLVARDRARLADLLRARAARHERQRLIALLVKPGGHLEFVGLRTADDSPAAYFRRVRLTLGKGKVHCDSASIEALNAVDEGDAEQLLARAGSLPAGWIPAELPAFAQPIIDALRRPTPE
jgi:hypothetical protein